MYCVIVNTDHGLRIGIDEQPIGVVVEASKNTERLYCHSVAYSRALSIPLFSDSDTYVSSELNEFPANMKCIDNTGYVLNDLGIEFPARKLLKHGKVYSGFIRDNGIFAVTDETGDFYRSDLGRFQLASE